MSAVLELTADLEFAIEPPREVWLVSRHEPRKRRRVLLTPEQEEKLLSTSRFEIEDGEFQERPMPNPEHGRIQAKITIKIGVFLESNPIGEVYTETSFELEKKLNRVPDVAFVSFERFPESGESDGSRWQIVPDLAIEIVSPTDDYRDVFKKLDEYLAASVKQVWLVSPQQKTVSVYRSRKDVTIFVEEDELVCEEVLPGFRLKLSEIFQTPQRP